MKKLTFSQIVSKRNISMLRHFILLFVLLLSVNGLRAQAVGDYGTNGSAAWSSTSNWIVCTTAGTWTGATTATALPSASTNANVWIRAGHTINVSSSPVYCLNLTIESGAKLWANVVNTTGRYVRMYGTTFTNNGEFGGTNDGLGLGLYNANITLTGSGIYGINRIQASVAGCTLTFDANALVTYAGSAGAGSSSIYNNGFDNFTVIVNAGKTLTTATLSYITIGTSGSSAPAAGSGLNITLNIYGTITTGTSGHVNLLNNVDATTPTPVSKTSTINIYSGGTLNCNGNLLMPVAGTGILNVAAGGTLNVNTGSIFKIGSTATTFTNSGTTNINGSFQIDEGLTASGNNFAYGAAGALILNNALPNFTVTGSSIFWPGTSGPINVTVQNTGGVQMQVPRTISGVLTVNSGSTLKTGANTFTNGGTATINGSFQLDEGGWATGNNFVYGSAGTLVFNNSSAAYGVSGSAAYWPTTSGPVNVTVQNTGGIQMQTARTITGIFQTSTGVGNTFGNDLTVSGTIKLNAGGYFNNFSPTYTSTGTLAYNTGGSFGVGNEWGAGSTVGYGVPQNVSILNATAVSLSGARTVPGILTMTSGKLSLGANNLTVGSISGASATNYIVTDGAGTLTQPVTAAGTVVFPIGASASSYDPVSVTPVSATNFSAKVSSTLSGTAAPGYNYNAKEWNMSSSTASSTALILTPSAVTASGINSIIGLYDGTNYVNAPATLASGAYSATVTSFPLIAVTGATDIGTGISSTKLNGITFDGQTIQNNANLDLQVFDITGRKVASSNKNINMNSNPKSIYIVKCINGTLKFALNK